MRDAKFRAKEIDTGEWLIGGYLHQTDFYGDECDKHFIIDGTTTRDYDIGRSYRVDPATLGQYTGLKDKNGKEIFEGDIVISVGVRLNGELTKFTGYVKWENYGLSYELYKETTTGFITEGLSRGGNYEVIGNTYDNPELLGEKDD